LTSEVEVEVEVQEEPLLEPWSSEASKVVEELFSREPTLSLLLPKVVERENRQFLQALDDDDDLGAVPEEEGEP